MDGPLAMIEVIFKIQNHSFLLKNPNFVVYNHGFEQIEKNQIIHHKNGKFFTGPFHENHGLFEIIEINRTSAFLVLIIFQRTIINNILSLNYLKTETKNFLKIQITTQHWLIHAIYI